MAESTAASPLRVFCISDLHLEFPVHCDIPRPAADVLVLAGDVGYAGSPVLSQFLKECSAQYRHVVMVPGNHEYYAPPVDQNLAMPYFPLHRAKTLSVLKEQCTEAKVHLLHRSSVQLDGVWFHGTTLWSAIDDGVAINDFGKVFGSRYEYLAEFGKDFEWLQETLRGKDVSKPHVVVTHHLPTHALIHPTYARYGEKANSAFATHVLSEMCMKNVKYWFCGHSHEHVLASYGPTQLVLNPVGYKSDRRRTKISSTVYSIPSSS